MIWGFVSCSVVGRNSAGLVLPKYLLLSCAEGKFKERKHLIKYYQDLKQKSWSKELGNDAEPLPYLVLHWAVCCLQRFPMKLIP